MGRGNARQQTDSRRYNRKLSIVTMISDSRPRQIRECLNDDGADVAEKRLLPVDERLPVYGRIASWGGGGRDRLHVTSTAIGGRPIAPGSDVTDRRIVRVTCFDFRWLSWSQHSALVLLRVSVCVCACVYVCVFSLQRSKGDKSSVLIGERARAMTSLRRHA